MNKLEIEKLVKESIAKFGKTYQMLEEYDKKSPANPTELADSERL